MLQALADLFARPMHREDGCKLAQGYFQMAALRGYKRASSLFQPPFEFSACHISRIQQTCCIINRTVASLRLMTRFVARRLERVEILGEAALVGRQEFADAGEGRGFQKQTGVVILRQAPDDFRVVVCRSIGTRLAGERNQQGRVVPIRDRSEEHTSELQSLRHLVCRLLLEKKKNERASTPRAK